MSCATMEAQNRLAQIIQLYSILAGYDKGGKPEKVGVSCLVRHEVAFSLALVSTSEH